MGWMSEALSSSLGSDNGCLPWEGFFCFWGLSFHISKMSRIEELLRDPFNSAISAQLGTVFPLSSTLCQVPLSIADWLKALGTHPLPLRGVPPTSGLTQDLTFLSFSFFFPLSLF